MKEIYKDFLKLLGKDRVKFEDPLSQYTTVGIGGPGEIVYKPKNTEELENAARLAYERGLPVTIIGGGSNVLIADRGLRGLVLVNKQGQYSVGERKKGGIKKDIPESRWELDGTTVRYHFTDLDYDESDADRIKVVVDSGVVLQRFMYEMFESGITGLQWYSGIPGTLGGAVFNNLHGGTHFFSEVISSVRILTPEGEMKEVAVEELQADYNYTIFHEEDCVIVDAVLELYLGDEKKAKYVADEWRRRKHKIQPQKTLGCVFANISQEEREKHDLPTTSVGHIVEHILKFSNYRVGNAFIPTLHHNFIETDGPAKATDYLQVIKDVKNAVRDELGIELKTEIITKGFTEKELEGVYS